MKKKVVPIRGSEKRKYHGSEEERYPIAQRLAHHQKGGQAVEAVCPWANSPRPEARSTREGLPPNPREPQACADGATS